MYQKEKTIKYYIYARKSTESEDRQVQSIEDQVIRLKKLADELCLEIKEIFTEAKSAKEPENREIFNGMLKKLENGEANGILCWKLDRLSRNPIDSARLSWSLQKNVIKSIRTIERDYLPEDNVIIFNVESGMSNQFIIDLKKNVKRGLEAKLRKGFMPSKAPTAYLNTKTGGKGENFIIKDTERFNLVRKMFDLMLTGNYSVPQIQKIANENWKLTTVKSRKRGGAGLSRTSIYAIFTNIFYTGLFKYKGNIYEGKHPPLVTLEEYDRVQMLLGRRGKQRPKIRQFTFRGLIRCGECDCCVTAATKNKLIKNANQIKEYHYYFCSGRKKDYKCSQTKVITVEELEKQIENEILKITITPTFRDRALKVLNELNDKEIHNRTNIHEIVSESFLNTQKELDNLTRMHYKEMITEDEYLKQRNELVIKIIQLKQKLRETEDRANNWLKLTERVFIFATNAYNCFTKGNIKTKRDILNALGCNYLLKSSKLTLQQHPLLEPISDTLAKAKPRLELVKTTNEELSGKSSEDLASGSSELYPQPDLNRCYRRERAMS